MITIRVSLCPTQSRGKSSQFKGRSFGIPLPIVARGTTARPSLVHRSLARNKYRERAAEIGRTVESEHGTEAACIQIEEVLRRENQSAVTGA